MWLQLLSLPPAGLRSFVLDSDPIPRAMLSIDPTFAFVKQWPAVKSVMQIGRWFTGQQGPAPVTLGRFMYNSVGEVYLIKWTVGHGHKVGDTRLVHHHPWPLQALCHASSAFLESVQYCMFWSSQQLWCALLTAIAKHQLSALITVTMLPAVTTWTRSYSPLLTTTDVSAAQIPFCFVLAACVYMPHWSG